MKNGSLLTSAIVVALAGGLCGCGDDGETADLIADLKDYDASVRADAAAALGRIGDARAVEPLVAALNDMISWERAATSLGSASDESSVPMLPASYPAYADMHSSLCALFPRLQVRPGPSQELRLASCDVEHHQAVALPTRA